jgi:hypothetical protein
MADSSYSLSQLTDIYYYEKTEFKHVIVLSLLDLGFESKLHWPNLRITIIKKRQVNDFVEHFSHPLYNIIGYLFCI